MKKIIIFISLFFMFTINTFAYVDYTELESSDSYQFNDDFSKVKLKDNYYIWGERDVLYIVTSNKELQIDERSGGFYIRCYQDNCPDDITTYIYRKNSKGQYTYQSTSSYGPEITYNFKIDLRETVESSINKVSYKEFFPNLTTFYSNKPLKEKYVQVTLPKKELPTLLKNKLVGKGDILDDIAKGFDSLFGGLGNWFNQLFNWLNDILKSIKDIPILVVNGILDGLKALFIPNDQYFTNQFDGLKNKFNNIFRIDISFLNYSGSSRQINQDDFMLTNEWGTFKLLDLTYLNSAFEKIRPILRGFFGFLILLFNVDQFGRFIGVGGLSNIVTIVKGESKK